MKIEKKPIFQEVKLENILPELSQVNPELAIILTEISPGKKFRLYCAEYPFGENYVEQGKFRVPIAGKMQNIEDSSTPKQLRDDLGYNIGTNPVSVILKNSMEIHMSHKVTGIPITLAIIPEGSMISIARILAKNIPHQPAFLWNMTSGARSLFSLPKISQKRKYRSLRSSLGIDTEIPKNSLEHIRVFKNFFSHESVQPWNTKVLYFSNEWFQYLEDQKWIKFKVHLLECLRNIFEPLGSMSIWDMIISLILKERDIRPSLYVINTVKQLLMIGTGVFPGIAPVTNEKCGPIYDFQKILAEYYKVDYIPTILAPSYLDMYSKSSKPILYSLQHPNLLEDAPRKKDNSSLLSETYDAASLLEKVLYSLEHTDYNIQETPLHDMPKKVCIEAFHPEPKEYSKIKNSNKIVEEDDRFSTALYQGKTKSISINSSIFKGCFQLKQR